jgi:hypothetical protein
MNKERLIEYFIKGLLQVLSPERLQKIINKSLDYVDEVVTESKMEFDDKIVLPIVKVIRDLVNN